MGRATASEPRRRPLPRHRSRCSAHGDLRGRDRLPTVPVLLSARSPRSSVGSAMPSASCPTITTCSSRLGSRIFRWDAASQLALRRSLQLAARLHGAPVRDAASTPSWSRAKAHFLESARYIVLNPLRAGLCAQPGDWPSAATASTLTPSETFVESSRLQRSVRQRPAERRERAMRRSSPKVSIRAVSRCLAPGARPDQPKPYVPAKRFARRRTRSAAGSPTTFR